MCLAVAAACHGHHEAVVVEMDGERLKLLPGFKLQNLPGLKECFSSGELCL